jgi:hypothetical protein
VVTKRDDEDVSGRIIEETDSKLVLVTNPLAGEKVEIRKSRREKPHASKLSPMPDGLVNILTRKRFSTCSPTSNPRGTESTRVSNRSNSRSAIKINGSVAFRPVHLARAVGQASRLSSRARRPRRQPGRVPHSRFASRFSFLLALVAAFSNQCGR